ncbi:MAG: antibiotic biosynthesis monooxygenase [Chloroflexota bacterium]|nr:antibiotic biosynthesis monooxygenase [Chloroflexota bacterium]
MAYVVAATWRAKEGEEERIREIIETITPLSRAEPACRFYQAHRSPEDARLFFLYEQYDDEAGYEAHMATEHFEKYVRGDAIPRLESRDRAFYVTMD